MPKFRPHEIVLRAELKHPGYIVLTDTWYPGWQAWLDGRPVPIERANLAFRAIYAPRGVHDLAMHYQPSSFAWGLRISLGTLIALSASLIPSVLRAFHCPSSTRRSANSGV